MTSAERVDTVVVVIHGVGEQIRGETLLEWAEPLREQLNILARRNGGEGAVVERSVLTSDLAMPISSEVLLRVGTGPDASQLIRFTEARWSRAFLQFSNRQVFFWAAGFVPRAVGRLARHFCRQVGAAARNLFRSTTVLSAGQRLANGPDDPEPQPEVPAKSVGWAVLAVVVYIAGGLAAIGILVPVVLTVGLVLLLLAELAFLALGLVVSLPYIGPKIMPFVLAFTTTVGDAGALVNSPVRAAAMRDVVREEVRAAGKGADRVVVLAHSQGAAVAVRALLEEGSNARVDVLLTVGAGVTLLRPKPVGGDPYPPKPIEPVAWWAPQTKIRWTNFWATADPVPSGPIADSEEDVERRRQECYDTDLQVRVALEQTAAAAPKPATNTYYSELEAHSASPGAAGPEERPVLSRASLLEDHTAYSRNVPHILTPIARILLGDEFEREGFTATARAERERWSRHVRELLNARMWAAIVGLLATPWLIAWLTGKDVTDWLTARVLLIVLTGVVSTLLLIGLTTAFWSIPLGAVRRGSVAPYTRAIPFQIWRLVLILAAALAVLLFPIDGTTILGSIDAANSQWGFAFVIALLVLLYLAPLIASSPGAAPARRREVKPQASKSTSPGRGAAANPARP